MNFEDKVLQIHLVISLYLIEKYTLLQHMPFPCGFGLQLFFFFLISVSLSPTGLQNQAYDIREQHFV